MDADGSLFREQDPDWGIEVPNDDLDETREEGLKRARQLGFTATQAQQIADALAGIFRDQSLTFIEYDGIAQTYWEIDDLSEENRKTLEALAQKRRPGALYALACLYRLEDPPTESDGYWFRAQQAGQMLTGRC